MHFRMYALCEPHSPQLASAIKKALRASVLLGALILGVLASAAIWSVPLIYSEKWLPALPIVWSLLPHVLADIAMAQLVAMAQGQGKPGTALWFYVIWSVATWAVCGATLLAGDQALDWIGWGQSLATVGAACFALRWASLQAATAVGGALVRPLVAVTVGSICAYAACAATPGASLLRAFAGMGTFLIVAGLSGVLLDRDELMRDVRGAWAALRTKRSR